ncbi:MULTISPECIES: KdsC family phosphatase [Desulfococcus]|jgi:3-deoxy-D-manno-octulosonate 8-phosphate phosphatase (KDO 8-P phosphatase)|uniref:3-deoxy-D-manno-octulosonate 8-phosphate phosphatase, YrbI family n=1 Tax=Desulfococcus multivorans DSM 2059 TaxID=1121405 RepID=S7V2K8_DESML|nr:HAD-IIIA family hydrolase [Desulfococcus multivorans]AOY57803.1 KdsC: 3-deoxy-D-manno-octulosonate 8-phosphatase [Desulfococcus multivorans]AQV00188.1 phenylphosphate carboxylase subunit delta [Desulfococcus multivorans]EPR38888.1 3-deoxy-D-manno-octulosonate 8-phosphate phosphatase, YrbI family [Desulfococcus multivorans DSM 2059]MDX9819834.1 HAD-IIIA family hydrolase [Desulfococcus multivorans]SJZ67961.1 3-deoxy-D-manno-octulosonate 8-phosphate phosphatase (KDO 8-P phosphatase) [Desulfoco
MILSGPEAERDVPLKTEKLREIRLLLLDVDGVMTDGRITYTESGAEIKSFDVKDGLGIRLAMDAGIRVGVVTARTSEALRHRCRNLAIDLVFDGVRNKRAVLDDIVKTTGVSACRIAFVGDDLQDLPLMRRVGFSVAVADAHDILIEHADMVTTRRGGRGAVREVCEALLKAQGAWGNVMNRYVNDEK